MKRKFITAARLLTGSFTPFLLPFWEEVEQQCVKDWLAGGHFSDATTRLELTIAEQLGLGYTVHLLNSGRVAIQLALESMRLPAGSEVLLPSFACTGVLMPVVQAGLQPVLVDVDTQFNMRFESVLEADSPDVKALILPHLSGCWARDAEKIFEWATKRKIFVIEDCAQSLGLKRAGKLAGTFGDVAIFSCSGGKPIFSSGGAWVVTRNSDLSSYLASRQLTEEPREEVAKRIRRFVASYTVSNGSRGRNLLGRMVVSRLRNHREVRTRTLDDYRFPLYAISDIEAQLAWLQMQKLETIIDRRQKFAARWREKLENLGLATLRLLPTEDNTFTKMLLSFVGENSQNEARLLKRTLRAYGIEIEATYTPLYLRSPFKAFRQTSMPMINKQWQNAFTVPVRPNLNVRNWQQIEDALSSISRSSSDWN